MADIVLQAQKRDAVGKNKVNKLRQEAIVPGVVYAKEKDNINVQFTSRDFEKVLSEAGTTTIKPSKPKTKPAKVTKNFLSKGDKGSKVTQLQKNLKKVIDIYKLFMLYYKSRCFK